MKKRKQQSKRARAGFTLAESLVAILILLMAAAIVGAGLPSAQRAYINVVDTANAEVLLSTTLTAIQDELGSARGFKLKDDDKTLDYYESADMWNRRARLVNSGDAEAQKGIIIEYPDTDGETVITSRKLVSFTASTGLYTEFDSITFENGVFTIRGLAVKRSTDGKLLAGKSGATADNETGTYMFRPMNPNSIIA